MTEDTDAKNRERIEQALASGMTREAVIASIVIDDTVIDRMKHAGRLGLTDNTMTEGARERWTLAEMIHAVEFGKSTMTREQIVAAFQHALTLAGL